MDQTALLTEEGGSSARDVFFYYMRNALEAVRRGSWKLHLRKEDGTACPLLYNLTEDPAESRDLAAEKPELVADLMRLAHTIREDLGDEAEGIPEPGAAHPAGWTTRRC